MDQFTSRSNKPLGRLLASPANVRVGCQEHNLPIYKIQKKGFITMALFRGRCCSSNEIERKKVFSPQSKKLIIS
jgi:hypothetical protein